MRPTEEREEEENIFYSAQSFYVTLCYLHHFTYYVLPFFIVCRLLYVISK